MQQPSFIEDHISQIPALQWLIKLGYTYLSPQQALDVRGNRTSNVLLEQILRIQLERINQIDYRGQSYSFSEANVTNAILALRDLPIQDGLMAANKSFYDLITLGKSFEQTIQGNKKSYSFRYIDWANPANNVYHVTEEFSVLRSERTDTYRPDIVLFVNGIPLVVIECKSPKIKRPIEQSLEQHLRNQQEDGIRSLYYYSSILIGLSVQEARYGTTGTAKEFWSVWKEQFRFPEESTAWQTTLQAIKQAPLPKSERNLLFQERFTSVLQYFNELEDAALVVTEQDKLLYALCRPERLLELIYHYTLYDDGVKKLTRYQQYFAVKWTMERVLQPDADGRRQGGVIWHTQGSGKSLTMVMLAQLLSMHPSIKNPQVVLVTDRVDLDDQITDTFRKCGKPVWNASTGEKLVELLQQNSDAIITTIINKFQSAVTKADAAFDNPNIFVLVDESHRTQYGTFNVKMQRVFPRACYIAFTGTPLLKQDKSTASKFGGIIPGTVYTITDAVADKAVLPLLYEGRHNLMQVNAGPLDAYFERISEKLTDYGKAALKKKFSSRNAVVQSQAFIESTAWDIVDHFTNHIQGTGFKAQLVAPNKRSAIRYRSLLKEIGRVSVELLISPPDDREGEDDAFEVSEDEVKAFHKAMMDKYGNQEKYEKSVINSFKKQDEPEIIIVVDKLLTGFDAPRNQVLYLTRNLREHTLLQAIARVNRLYPGKEYGYIIDYYGNLENLDDALHTYSGLEGYDAEDLADTFTHMREEIAKLPQAHSDVWQIFQSIQNKYDEPAYEELLADEEKRYHFYQRLSAFARLLKLALSNLEFTRNTPEKLQAKYKSDVKFFLALRVSVKRRYFDALDFSEYEPQVQKLIDRHITSAGEVLQITEMVNIFDAQEREAELEKIGSAGAKADHIASRTIRAIEVKMNEDPVFYKKLSELIRQTIDDYHQKRLTEAEYLRKARELEQRFFQGQQDQVPAQLQGKPTAIAFYNLATETWKAAWVGRSQVELLVADLADGLDQAVRSYVFDGDSPMIDWQKNDDIKGRMRIAMDDWLFECKNKHQLPVSLDDIDQLLDEAIQVAEAKYKRV